jgi:hypothetical protein
MSACDDDEVALESKAFGHGIFTHSLLTELTRSTKDVPTIPVGTLYDRIAYNVRRITNNQQTPVLNGRSRNFSLPCLIPRTEEERDHGPRGNTPIDQ